MKRTAEKILSIIKCVLSTIGVIIGVFMASLFNFLKSDPMFQMEFEKEMLLIDPTMTTRRI